MTASADGSLATISDLRAALSEFEARTEEAGLEGKEAAKLLRRMRRHTDRLAAFRAEKAEEAAEEAAMEARRLAKAAAESQKEEQGEEARTAAAAAAAAANAKAAAENASRARRDAWSARLWNDPLPTASASSSVKALPGAEADVDAFIAHMRREALKDERRRKGLENGDDGSDEEEREERAVWLALGKKQEPLPLPSSSSQKPAAQEGD